MGSSTCSLALLLALQATAAQSPNSPLLTHAEERPRRVAGAVDRPGKGKMDSLPGQWVTLHRVGSDRQGPLDSARTDSRGRYSFTYRRTGDPGAVYFVSASHEGIAYFTPPLEGDDVNGVESEITVFDTTSRHVPISVRGHHLVISAVDADGMRSVVEVYEIANDSSVTKVASGRSGDRATWQARLLPGAVSATVREGDFPADAVAFDSERVALLAPLAPGLKQLAFGYALPASAFPLSIPVEDAAGVLEVMLEEKVGTATGARLKEVAPVAVDQRTFRRFLASDVPVNSVATIDLPAPPRPVDSRYVVALVLALGGVMIAVLARALRRT